MGLGTMLAALLGNKCWMGHSLYAHDLTQDLPRHCDHGSNISRISVGHPNTGDRKVPAAHVIFPRREMARLRRQTVHGKLRARFNRQCHAPLHGQRLLLDRESAYMVT